MDKKDQEIADLKSEVAALKKILTLMPGNVYWKDRSGKYLGCNENNARLINLKLPEEIVGKTAAELMKPEYVAAIDRVDNEIMSTDREQTLEELAYDIAGNSATYLTRKIPLHDDQANVIGLVGVSFDITERKATEERAKNALEKSKDEEIFSLKKIISLMPGNVYWLDKNGLYLGCNDNVAKTLSLISSDEIVGKDNAELIGKEFAEHANKINQEVMLTNKELVIEEAGFDDNGERAIYLSRKTPLQNNTGEVVGLLGVSMDITDRKKMEEELLISKEKAEIASRAKTQFLSVASHELRIPLTGIIGLANFLESGELTEQEEREYTKHILTSSKHLLTIVNDILDFAKLEADKFELSSTSIDLKMLLEEVVLMLTASAKTKNLELWVSYEPNAPHRILSDSRALRQIVINLVGNAIKFTEQGNIAIKVRCLQQTEKIAQFEIAVVDTGIGIPADKQDIIFERFQQIESAYTRAQGGTGLGLAIVQKLIQQMGGDIRVESTVGVGTTFYCVLEFPLQDKAYTEAPWSLYEANVRTLVIDDTGRGEIICRHIGTANSHAVPGNEAIHTLISAQEMGHPYDVVIIDQQIQTADPFELLSVVKKQKNLRKPMAILLLPNGAVTEKRLAISEGFFETIVKPVQPTAMQTILTSAWEKWIEFKENNKE